MKTRLAWFPLYVDDWQGGVAGLLPAELGAYIQALVEQWSSKDLQAIPDDPETFVAITHGAGLSNRLRRKFEFVEIEGVKYLRNARLAQEWERAKKEYDARSRGGKQRARQIAQQVAEMDAQLQSDLPHNSQSTTHNSQRTAESVQPLFAAFAHACCLDPVAVDERTANQINSAINLMLSD